MVLHVNYEMAVFATGNLTRHSFAIFRAIGVIVHVDC